MSLNIMSFMPRRGKNNLFINNCGDDINLLESPGVSPFSRECHPQVTLTQIIHGHLRLYIGDHSIDHFRFDFVRLATARLGKGGSFRCARRNSWIHDAFFSTTRILQSRVATKGNRWKNAARRDRIAYNRRELRWILGR